VRIRPSTLAIVFVVALLFAGLYITDSSLRRSDDLSGRADAQEAAAVASSFLLVQSEALSALNGLFVDDVARPGRDRFEAILSIAGENLTRFQVVGVTDSAGVLLHYAVARDGRLVVAGRDVDLDTLALAGLSRLTARARATRTTVISPPVRIAGGDSSILLLDPVIEDSVFRGFVGGSVPLVQLRSTIQKESARQPSRRGLLLTTSLGDTVLSIGRQGSGTDTSSADVLLPSGRQWRLVVYHARRSAVRWQLTGVALAALTALVLGGWHERRQSRRISDRSRELERLSEQLLDANRAKSEFLANVSHELRTPLNAIVGFTELLRDGVYGELTPRQAGPVERIEASAGHLRLLVDQVLDLAKMTAGRLEVHPEAVDLRQVMLDVGTEMEPLFAERRLSFTISVGAGVPRLRTDPAHLRQILVNLLGNAVKFTETGGITVRTRLVSPSGEPDRGLTPAVVTTVPGAPRVSGGYTVDGAALRDRAPDPDLTWVALQVSDTGLGIAPRDVERIFDEFEQVNPGSRGDSERRGTGLGLPISRRLARLLGGELTVESRPGHGSTFTLWLPVS